LAAVNSSISSFSLASNLTPHHTPFTNNTQTTACQKHTYLMLPGMLGLGLGLALRPENGGLGLGLDS